MKSWPWRIGLVLVLLASVLAGCGDPTPQPTAPAAQVAAGTALPPTVAPPAGSPTETAPEPTPGNTASPTEAASEPTPGNTASPTPPAVAADPFELLSREALLDTLKDL
ncbi:MAG: hypothetical protein PVF47_01410, partial [Anaerolineae bacterium]